MISKESYRLRLFPLLAKGNVDLTDYLGEEVITFRVGGARNLERGVFVKSEDGCYGLRDEENNVVKYRSTNLVAFIVVSRKE